MTRLYNGVSCMARNCNVRFIPRHIKHKYCSLQCKRREASRNYYLLHSDVANQANLRSHFKYHQQRLKQQRNRYHANKDIERLRGRLYALLNPQKAREIGRVHDGKRRAQKLKCADITLTTIEWEHIKAQYQYKCAYCDKVPTLLTQDHVIPLSKGGLHTASNIVPACAHCNLVKGNRDVEYFLRELL